MYLVYEMVFDNNTKWIVSFLKYYKVFVWNDSTPCARSSWKTVRVKQAIIMTMSMYNSSSHTKFEKNKSFSGQKSPYYH